MEPGTQGEPVLAHVLFMDIVGCSKLPSDEQQRIVGRLQELVCASAEFQRSRATDQVISLPTGDGMALAFFNKLDAAVQCAIEITKTIQAESLCSIRMGVHTGPVFVMNDINQKRNISGAGINRAERVMSCGEDRHILLSDNVAESLRHLSAWASKIYEIGECRVKDGRIRVWNLVDGPIGNPALPKKSKRYLRRRRMLITAGEAVLAAAILATVAVAFWAGRTGRGSQTGDQASIAVLPFADMSPEKNHEYFSDGLTEELLNGLARIPGLRVAGRTSSFKFKGKTEDSRVIGQKLRVATLLEGSVRIQGKRARIAAQLIKVEDGFGLWSDTFNREVDDALGVQEEIARAVTGALKVRLLPAAAGSAAARSTNGESYDAYLQGKYFLGKRGKEALDEATNYFGRAIELERNFAPAWVGLSEARGEQAGQTYIPVEEGYRKAREAVERALALDPNLADALRAKGSIQMFSDFDWAGADASFQKALALEPRNARALRSAGSLARFLGRLEDAVLLYNRAIQIDPLDAGSQHNLGMVLHYAGRHAEAGKALRKALELTPEILLTHELIGQVYLAQGHANDGLAEMEREKHPVFRALGLALAHQALGRRKESDANLAELIEKFASGAPYQIAQIYAYRGDKDRAFEWLNRAFAERDPGITDLKIDPLFKGLKSDPRYFAMLKTLRLPL